MKTKNHLQFKYLFLLSIFLLSFNVVAITVEEAQEMLADDAANNDAFGWSVAVDGDTAIVGANKDDTSNGGVYVFTRDLNGIWSQQAKLQEATPGGEYGFSVAIDGDIAVVGAYISNGIAGEVFVHTRSGTTWSTGVALSSLTSNSCQFCEQFGRSVAVSGTTVVVGSIFDNGSGNGLNAGAAYVFVPNGASWQPDSGTPSVTSTVGMLIASVPGEFLPIADGNEGDHFGSAVAIDGDTIVIGAENFNSANDTTSFPAGNAAVQGQGTGAAYVFTRSAGNWSPVQKLESGLAANSVSKFGHAIDVENNRIIVGAYTEGTTQDNGTNAEGAAYIFERTAFGQAFGSSIKLTPSTTASSRVGTSVAIFGDNALVGAAGQNRVYLYSYIGNSWNTPQELSKSFSTTFGQSVGIDAETFLVGDSGAGGQGDATFYVSVDLTPDPFSFTSVLNAAGDDFITSNSVTITGIDANATVSVTNGSMSINGGAFTVSTTTIANNDTVRVQGLSSSDSQTTETVVLTVGDVSGQFNITTGDVISPEISAPPNITVTTSLASIVVDLLSNGAPNASDDVDANPIITHNQIANSVSFNAPGVYTVIWTATDSAGNIATDTQTITVNQRTASADVSISLSTDFNSVTEGDDIFYTLQVANAGVDSATNVTTTFTVPTNTTLDSYSANCNDNADIVTCTQTSLASNSQVSFFINVTDAQLTTANANASASVSADETDPDTANNSASSSVVVEAALANLETQLTRTGATIIDVNETVTSTLTITNTGNAIAGNVVVNVSIEHYSDPDLEFTNIELAQCVSNGTQVLGSRLFDAYSCDLGDIASNESIELVITATSPAEASTLIAILNITATSLGSVERNISIPSKSGSVEVDEGGGGGGAMGWPTLFMFIFTLLFRCNSNLLKIIKGKVCGNTI